MSRTQIGLVALALVAGSGRAAEPWADPDLPVTSGLELWLDATRPGAGKPKGGPLAFWADASGKRRDVRQTLKGAQPRRLAVGGSLVVRFDGLDDVLRSVGQLEAVPGFTLFAVLSPQADRGGFVGFLSFNAAGQRDYTSGLNLDMGNAPSQKLVGLKVQGRGFQGERMLPVGGGKFGRLYTVEAVGDPAAKTVRFVADGKPAGSRPWTGAAIGIDEVTIGARFPDAADRQEVRGHAPCDIAEVLFYNRPLSGPEATRVRGYLTAKYGSIRDDLPPASDGRGEPLVPVADPPAVQVLGFEVRELPVKLQNINNVRCRPDGTVMALGYDGTVYRLRDTDGDGVEDNADAFEVNTGSLRAPIGMALTHNSNNSHSDLGKS